VSELPGDPASHASPEVATPATPGGREGLAAILADPVGALLAVDYDGVLAPIVPDPTNSPPLPGIIPALARVAERLGSVAVISGRPVPVLLDYCGFGRQSRIDGLVVFGHYGLQRWDARTGEITQPPPPPALDAVRRELPGLLATAGVPDAWIEDKTVAVAVHTRRTIDPAVALAILERPITQCALSHGLSVEPGRYVLEIRPPGVDKGRTLRSYARSIGARAVCYVGDDLGDIPAFEAVRELRAQGTPGLTVASGSTETVAVTELADLVVDGPPGVLELLTALAGSLPVKVSVDGR
jgi:trehalose 6-phosphate phosphatase